MTTSPTDPLRADAPDPGDVAAVRASGGPPAMPRIGPWPGALLLAPTALIAALGPWLLPETFPIAAEFGRGRLNWPTS